MKKNNDDGLYFFLNIDGKLCKREKKRERKKEKKTFRNLVWYAIL